MTKTSILDLLDEIDQHNDNELTTSSSTPPSTPHSPSSSSFQFMVNYIKTYHEDIPQNLRSSSMTNDHGVTLAMYWIRIMRLQIARSIRAGNYENVVPEWMTHKPDYRDNFGWTIAMHWVNLYGCDTPSWMRHDSSIRNKSGKTIAMVWLTTKWELGFRDDEDVPDWMHHDISILDEDGNSVVDYWLACTRTNLPEWIVDGIQKVNEKGSVMVNGNGETVAMSWVLRRRTPVPEDVMAMSTSADGSEMKTSYGLTLDELKTKMEEHDAKVLKEREEMKANEEEVEVSVDAAVEEDVKADGGGGEGGVKCVRS